MAPVTVPVEALREFPDFHSFYDWLAHNHDSAPEVWIRIFKKGAGKPTVTPVEAIDAVLCWGWIDAIRKAGTTKALCSAIARAGPNRCGARSTATMSRG